MWRWLRLAKRVKQSDEKPLRGAPRRARTKTYSSSNGHVYQYVYRGWRPILRAASEDSGVEYLFRVSRGSAKTGLVCVRLLEAEIVDCRKRIGRDLLDPERYAIVKMSLFAAFDEIDDFVALGDPIVPRAISMQECLETLGRL